MVVEWKVKTIIKTKRVSYKKKNLNRKNEKTFQEYNNKAKKAINDKK